MKQLTCEMCGSTDLIKQDGVFVCQSCGTKYSVEEAKKIMVEGTVDISGSTIKIDTSDELSKLYQNARRYKEINDTKNALKYYETITSKVPDDWEAYFYSTYYGVLSHAGAGKEEFSSSFTPLFHSIGSVIKLVEGNVSDAAEREGIFREIQKKCEDAGSSLRNSQPMDKNGKGTLAYAKWQDSMNIPASELEVEFYKQLCNVCGEDKDVMLHYGVEALKNHLGRFGVDYGRKRGMDVDLIVTTIKKYEPQFELPISEKPSSGGGCYVATAIYGSYDCPQVWTLRRYRDDTLAQTWYGRAFIHTYYAISPTLVKWFGNTTWFKNMWKPHLDRLVEKLRQEGVADTPYNNDKKW